MRLEDHGSQVVEERVVMKPHGETVVRKYIKGK